MKFNLGASLEVLGAASLIVAGFIWAGTVLAAALIGIALLYFAQVYDGVPIGLPVIRKRKAAEPFKLSKPIPSMPADVPVFHCSVCGGSGPIGTQHICSANL